MHCGVDIGSRSIEVVLLSEGTIFASGVADTGNRPGQNADNLLREVCADAGIRREDIDYTIATGYGRNYFEKADGTFSEILCHAAGISYLFPDARTVIDIGGQDSKLISLDVNGLPVDFSMNDRCAAGTGKFIEMTAVSLGVPLDRMFDLVQDCSESVEISSMCAVFAESEIIGLLQSGTSIPSILKGVFRSVARRVLGMAGHRGVIADLVFTGGVALNRGVVQAISEETGLHVVIPDDPRITGALGAALTGAKRN